MLDNTNIDIIEMHHLNLKCVKQLGHVRTNFHYQNLTLKRVYTAIRLACKLSSPINLTNCKLEHILCRYFQGISIVQILSWKHICLIWKVWNEIVLKYPICLPVRENQFKDTPISREIGYGSRFYIKWPKQSSSKFQELHSQPIRSRNISTANIIYYQYE